MQHKRTKWRMEDDELLKKLVKKDQEIIDWDRISAEMNEHGKIKSAKQCKERYNNKLSPSLNKFKFTESE